MTVSDGEGGGRGWKRAGPLLCRAAAGLATAARRPEITPQLGQNKGAAAGLNGCGAPFHRASAFADLDDRRRTGPAAAVVAETRLIAAPPSRGASREPCEIASSSVRKSRQNCKLRAAFVERKRPVRDAGDLLIVISLSVGPGRA
jgi:hypothetical protein